MSTNPGYSGTPLPRKLGMTGDARALVLGAPAGFQLDADYHVKPGRGRYDVVLLFCPDSSTLSRRWETTAARTQPRGAVWVAWPKRASKVPTDLTEDVVREHALPLGWVDVKVCAIDDVWSGLKLVRRLSSAP